MLTSLHYNLILTFSGINKGLTKVLDSHSDLTSMSSIDTDNLGFTGTVTSNSSFPLTFLNGFHIKPGHTNLAICLKFFLQS
jgi:hypothetical protein